MWSGPMALAGSRPVYVCLQTIYGLDSGIFLSIPPAYALSLTRRGLALCPERVYTPIKLIFAHFSAPPGYVHGMWSINNPSLKYDSFFPRGDTDSNTKAA